MTISARARKTTCVVMLLAILLTAPVSWFGQTGPAGTAATAQAGEHLRVVARLNSSAQHDVIAGLRSYDLVSAEPIHGLDDTFVMTFDSGTSSTAALAWLATLPGVVWAEADRSLDYAFSPGDPLSQDQLWIESIDLPAAWTITRGSDAIVVAVVDSGVSHSHPDLAGKVLPGYDFLNDHDQPVDDVGHGTAVAGIIAARGGDNIGIAGVAMDATILPVKVGSLDGSPISAIVTGIVWAVDEGADIINLSLGANFPSQALRDAVRYAHDNGVPVVTAAGNEPDAISYPGAYSEAISVGASTHWGTLTGFTSRANRVDLVAPGHNVLTTWSNSEDGDGWATVTGTSFAAPMVSGTLALLLSLDSSLTVEEMRSLVQHATVPVGNGDQEPGAGAGQLDAGATLSSFLARAFDNIWTPTDSPVATGATERTWVWGPDPIATGFESYDESASGERMIRYYDKARMEITDPSPYSVDPWFVTNGLLARELITGRMQLGDQTFLERAPADIVVAGDWGDPNAPTYANFASHLHAGPADAGAVITSRIDGNSQITAEPRFAAYEVYAAWFSPETSHQIASVFWTYLNSIGLIDMGGDLVVGPIFQPTFYATGLPITEAYWTEVNVGGELSDVLVQCFERRCLTYTPSNPPGWQVEMGNVGQHYFNWRYSGDQASNRPFPRLMVWNLVGFR